MRLIRLDLCPFGSFESRSLHFGEGSVDLHIVVGANEAGKSTMLTAIGDLLWKIDERTPYGFRYSYGELRLGGCIEHDGMVLDFLRRKSRTNQLLTQTGEALGDGVLTPFLGGLSRDAYDRMFGLNHERLRKGGRDLLEGREDVARVLFEAGTGLVGVGPLLEQLESEADELFTPLSRSKPLNVALKDREAKLAEARTSSLTPTKWQELSRAREEAQRSHDAALDETAQLEERRSVLERDLRVRPILAKIDVREELRSALGHLPRLNDNALQVRDSARSDRRTASEALARARGKLQVEQKALAQLGDPSPLLAHAIEVDRLADAAELHRSNVAERAALAARLCAIDQQRAAVFGAASREHADQVSFADDVLRAKRAWDAAVAADARRDRAEKALRLAQRSFTKAEEDLAALGTHKSLAALKTALDAAPRQESRTRRERASAVEASEAALARAFAQLAPWTGDVASLGGTPVPGKDVIEEHRAALAALADERRTLQEDRTVADQLAIASASALAGLASVGDELPTAAALSLAREARDVAIAELITAPEPAVALEHASALVRTADALADRREAEAARLSDFIRLSADAERARLTKEALDLREQNLERREVEAVASWQLVGQQAGFREPVTPLHFSHWLEERAATLDAADQLAAAQAALVGHDAEVGASAAAIRMHLSVEADGLAFDDLVRVASAELTELQEVAETRAVATAKLSEMRAIVADAEAEYAQAESAYAACTDMLNEAAAGLSLVSRDLVELGNKLQVFIDFIEKERSLFEQRTRLGDLVGWIEQFEADVQRLANAIGIPTHDAPSVYVLALRRQLNAARQTEVHRERALNQIQALTDEISAERAILSQAEERLRELMAEAGAEDDQDLDAIIDRCERGRSLDGELRELRDELAMAGAGVPETILRADHNSRSVDQVTAELATVQLAQQELVTRVSQLSAELAAAKTAEQAAMAGAQAADAAQEAEVAKATIIDLSEAYVRARSAATLLRWALNRHRETKQAPLLKRAGEIFAAVTGGRFSRLVLDWSQAEEPVIVGERPTGEICGVEQMSEGTRDQLFLSLRLAAIEERSAVHSMPLVCDDLLITADDDRAGRLIVQLAELSRSNQVICFTHHQHLVGVADRVIGRDMFRLHQVEPA